VLWRRLRRTYAGYLFISPAAALIVLFSYIAIIFSLYISLFDWDIVTDSRKYLGLANFRRALGDPVVGTSFVNTAVYVLGTVPTVIVGALLLAVLGKQVQRGRAVFRTIYFIPTITPLVVTSMIWIWIYESSGVLNALLGTFGIDGPNWLFTRSTAMPSVVILSVWAALGYYMIIFMAGLADIPEVFYEAAKVDGANRWQGFWYITVPLLRNSLIFALVTLTIVAFQVFTQVFILTQGGPANATTTVQVLIYRHAFQFLEMGYAGAISWLLFAVIFAFTAIQLKLFVSRELY
jgi:multiple sugar transport system permease protein